MRRNLLALAAAAALLSGCYRVTVLTGAPEAPTPAIDKPWQNSFVIGLVPPPEVDTQSKCPQGVAKVQTEHSFLNGLVAALTWSIYTPIHVTVTCATGPVQAAGH
jgi:Bor protein